MTWRISSVGLVTPGAEDAHLLPRLNELIASGAARRDWLLWDLADLATRVGYSAWFDSVRSFEAKIPFRIEVAPLVADQLSRLLAAIGEVKPAAPWLLDLDNTVWGGVIGDDGLSGIRVGQNDAEGQAYISFQHFVLELRRRGIVIAICSKNADEIARHPFQSHPEMVLREHHIAVFQVNWEDKATNVKAVADTLGLGLESLCFVDDNPAERARVRQELPLVTVPGTRFRSRTLHTAPRRVRRRV